MVDVEICIASDDLSTLPRHVLAAKDGGAKRIELCSHMQLDGLTASNEAIELCHSLLNDQMTLIAMIRPNANSFTYAGKDIHAMHQSIISAAKCGAKGVVFGALQESQSQFDQAAMLALINTAKELSLDITCHRAFDALDDPIEGLKQLKRWGVDRVLTTGTTWGKKCRAEDQITRLNLYLTEAAGDIEVIFAGAVNASSAIQIITQLKTEGENEQGYSFHAYSGVMTTGLVDQNKVEMLVRAANDINRS